MKKKKLTWMAALCLAAACTALLLSACGGEEKTADPSVQNTEAQTETEAEAPASTVIMTRDTVFPIMSVTVSQDTGLPSSVTA